jgi:hypothetical protein
VDGVLQERLRLVCFSRVRARAFFFPFLCVVIQSCCKSVLFFALNKATSGHLWEFARCWKFAVLLDFFGCNFLPHVCQLASFFLGIRVWWWIIFFSTKNKIYYSILVETTLKSWCLFNAEYGKLLG